MRLLMRNIIVFLNQGS